MMEGTPSPSLCDVLRTALQDSDTRQWGPLICVQMPDGSTRVFPTLQCMHELDIPADSVPIERLDWETGVTHRTD